VAPTRWKTLAIWPAISEPRASPYSIFVAGIEARMTTFGVFFA